MNRFLFLFLALFACSPTVSALGKVNVSLKAHARACPKTNDLSTIVGYLSSEASDQAQQVEVFSYWIADNIAYDTEAFLTRNYDKSANVLLTRKGTCQQYAKLLQAMCRISGIESHIVTGYTKGYGFTKTKKLPDTDHVWNVIKADGNYVIVDATWASGFVEKVNGVPTFRKKLDVGQILAAPDHFLQSHLPGDPRWQLRSNPITLEGFRMNDSIRDMVKLTLPTYHFADSIRAYAQADTLDRAILSAAAVYRFNPTANTLEHKADAIYRKAWAACQSERADQLNIATQHYQQAQRIYDSLNTAEAKTWSANCKDGIKYCAYKLKQRKTR